MDKVVLLKTQLAEAASFARSKQLGHKRLAVILLDNFVEIQLSGMIRQKFSWDELYYFQDRKYSVDRRVKILNHYDELLTSCVEEGIISSDERRLLAYCNGWMTEMPIFFPGLTFDGVQYLAASGAIIIPVSLFIYVTNVNENSFVRSAISNDRAHNFES